MKSNTLILKIQFTMLQGKFRMLKDGCRTGHMFDLKTEVAILVVMRIRQRKRDAATRGEGVEKEGLWIRGN